MKKRGLNKNNITALLMALYLGVLCLTTLYKNNAKYSVKYVALFPSHHYFFMKHGNRTFAIDTESGVKTASTEIVSRHF